MPKEKSITREELQEAKELIDILNKYQLPVHHTIDSIFDARKKRVAGYLANKLGIRPQ